LEQNWYPLLVSGWQLLASRLEASPAPLCYILEDLVLLNMIQNLLIVVQFLYLQGVRFVRLPAVPEKSYLLNSTSGY